MRKTSPVGENRHRPALPRRREPPESSPLREPIVEANVKYSRTCAVRRITVGAQCTGLASRPVIGARLHGPSRRPNPSQGPARWQWIPARGCGDSRPVPCQTRLQAELVPQCPRYGPGSTPGAITVSRARFCGNYCNPSPCGDVRPHGDPRVIELGTCRIAVIGPSSGLPLTRSVSKPACEAAVIALAHRHFRAFDARSAIAADAIPGATTSSTAGRPRISAAGIEQACRSALMGA